MILEVVDSDGCVSQNAMVNVKMVNILKMESINVKD